jgi:catechol 2,3-dioxygenase-like lactoylglutathione lyase family enzyme
MIMEYIHTGLAVSSEEKADRFYRDILGLEKSAPKTIDRNTIHAIFGIDSERVVMHYRSELVDFEIFVCPGYTAPEKQIAHSSFKVTDLADCVRQCREAGVDVIEVPKGSALLIFISDFDGNLFEMKQ